jgi:polyisoprenoid-binding protein YceI
MNISARLCCWTRRAAAVCLLLAWSAGAAELPAQESTFKLDPASTRIEFTLDAMLHTVHGSFRAKNGTIHFSPATGVASGLVVVDATSGDTGNDGRDRKMHKQVLQSALYPEITFTPARISGALATQGQSTIQIEGTLSLHGSDHPLSLSVPVVVTGNRVEAKAHFVVPFVAWGLRNPSTFLLRVSDKVEVEIVASGRLLSGGTGP